MDIGLDCFNWFTGSCRVDIGVRLFSIGFLGSCRADIGVRLFSVGFLGSCRADIGVNWVI